LILGFSTDCGLAEMQALSLSKNAPLMPEAMETFLVELFSGVNQKKKSGANTPDIFLKEVYYEKCKLMHFWGG